MSTKENDIILIFPPNTLEESLGRAKVFVSATPPYGILYLASFLEKHGLKVKVVDAFTNNCSFDDIVKIIRESGAKIAGISCLTSNAVVTEKLCLKIQEEMKNIKICLGNIHPTFYHEYYIKNKIASFIIHGEGEYTLLELVNKLQVGQDTSNIEGISYLKNEDVVRNPDRELIKNLDELPFPAREKVSIEKYKYPFFQMLPRKTLGILTSRGCPMGCTFCCVQHGRSYRFNSVDYVISEIEHVIKEYKAEYIVILDSLFITSRKRVYEFCKKIKERNLKIKWGCSGHINLIEDNLVKEMKSAGCERIDFGIESGVQSLLDYVNKKITIEGIKKSLEIVDQHGVSSVCAFIIGLPGETEAMTEKTIDFMLSLPIERANVSLLTLYPGTKMFYDILGQDTNKEMDWNRFGAYYSFGNKEPYYLPQGRTFKELKRKYFSSLWRFYMRPRQFKLLLKALKKSNITEVISNLKSVVFSSLKSV